MAGKRRAKDSPSKFRAWTRTARLQEQSKCTKGIHQTQPIHHVLPSSKARVVTNESIANDGRMVPAALDLPPGKLFFGFTYKPFDPNAATVNKVEPENGAGVRLPKFRD